MSNLLEENREIDVNDLEILSSDSTISTNEKKLSTFQKIFFYPLFFIILFCSIVLVYLSMLVLITMTIPTIFMLFTIFITHTTLSGVIGETLINILLIIVLFPVFSLFLSIIWQMMSSFLDEFWSNILNLMNLHDIEKRVFDPSTSFWYMILQLFLIIGLYITTFVFIILTVIANNDSGSFLLAINLIWTVYGIIIVLIHSWKALIFPSTKKVKDPMKDSELNKNKSKWFRIVLPIGVLDPANLRDQKDWINFINDPECNEFLPSHKKNKYMRIPGYIVGFLDIILILLLIYVTFTDEHSHNKFIYYLLPIICFVCFPFCVICPLTIPFYNRKKLEGKGSLSFILTGTVILYIVLLIATCLFWIFLGTHKEIKPPTIKYQYNTSTQNTILDQRPSFCSTKFGEYDLIQLSVLNTINLFTEKREKDDKCVIKEGSESNYFNTLRYVFGDGIGGRYIHRCFDNQLGTSIFYYKASINKYIPFILARSIDDKTSWGAFLETLFQQSIPSMIESIIPLYSIVSSLFNNFMTRIVVIMQKIFMIVPLVDGVSKQVYNNVKFNKLIDGKDSHVYVVGHSVGSQILKQAALSLPLEGAVFEGFPLYQTAESVADDTNSDRNDSYINTELLSFYSDNSFISGYDERIKININLPNIKNPLSFLNEIDDACMIAALCSENDKWASFCEQALNIYGDGVSHYNEIRNAAKEYMQ